MANDYVYRTLRARARAKARAGGLRLPSPKPTQAQAQAKAKAQAKALPVLAMVLTMACSPTQPTITGKAQAQADKPVHKGADLLRSHNIPAIGLDGGIVWVCETQARAYSQNGQTEWTFDHYIQQEPCPLEPIE